MSFRLIYLHRSGTCALASPCGMIGAVLRGLPACVLASHVHMTPWSGKQQHGREPLPTGCFWWAIYRDLILGLILGTVGCWCYPLGHRCASSRESRCDRSWPLRHRLVTHVSHHLTVSIRSLCKALIILGCKTLGFKNPQLQICQNDWPGWSCPMF